MFHLLNCRFWNQVSHDHRSCERNLSNCVKKPEKVRTSTGFEPVTSRYRCDALANWAMHDATDVGSWSFVSSNKPVHNCDDHAPVSRGHGFINPVEVLTFSGFFMQLLKLRSQLRWSWLTWSQNPQLNIWNISYITSYPFFTGLLELTND